MAGEEKKRYLEMQMEELKATYGVEKEDSTSVNSKVDKARNEKDAEIAKLYEDAAEYEEDLKYFEEELKTIQSTDLADIAAVLTKKFPETERDFAQELKVVLEAGWKHSVDVEKTHPKEQLELIKETKFCDVVEKFKTTYPDPQRRGRHDCL